MTGFVNTTAKK